MFAVAELLARVGSLDVPLIEAVLIIVDRVPQSHSTRLIVSDAPVASASVNTRPCQFPRPEVHYQFPHLLPRTNVVRQAAWSLKLAPNSASVR